MTVLASWNNKTFNVSVCLWNQPKFCRVKASFAHGCESALSSWSTVDSDQTWQKKNRWLCAFVYKHITLLLQVNEWSVDCMFSVCSLSCCKHNLLLNLYFLWLYIVKDSEGKGTTWCLNVACCLSLPQKKMFNILSMRFVA